MDQSKRFNYQKGKQGEALALDYLKNMKFRLIETNYKCSYGEIDLIMTDKDTLVFIEVKLKIGDEFGLPEEMIDPGKISRISKSAQYYLIQREMIIQQYQRYRIDAVCIVLDNSGEIKRINHYDNIGA